MKLAFIGTYPPRQCGIGTFTNNLAQAIVANCEKRDILSNAYVVAMNDMEDEYEYPPEVKFEIRQEHQRDYVQAANYINTSDAKVCILEHEYGIFGGQDGIYILPLIYRLEVPLIVTLHTILKNPSENQRYIVQEFSRRAQKLIVMSEKAVKFLKESYNISEDKIMIIEHGVPDIERRDHEEVKKQFNFQDKTMLFTFGLLSRNKGIETVINAMPAIIEKHPDLKYMLLGNTHPAVVRHSGEEYRNYLMRLVKYYGLEDNVVFNKRFVSEETLFNYLSAIDIYITPYLNEAQITSGTLSYAVGAGAAVISTPYWHAQELLEEGRGILFDFRDHEQLSKVIVDLLDDPAKLKDLRNSAFNYGLNIRWPKIGKQYLDLIYSVSEIKVRAEELADYIIDPMLLPPFSMDHVRNLTDDTGIVQHAKFGIPNLKEGYSLDDNARALIMTVIAYRQSRQPLALQFLPVFLSFIQYMQTEDGYFRNMLSFDRKYLDGRGSEDSFGRTAWALGFLIRFTSSKSYRSFAMEIFEKSVSHFGNLDTLRGNANTIIGLGHYLKSVPADEEMISILIRMSNKLVKAYNTHKTEEWHWFENTLTYDNGILPLAMVMAFESTGDRQFLDIAVESIRFLDKVLYENGKFVPVGNHGWYTKGEEKARFAQQSIDVMSMVLLYYRMFLVTRDKYYIRKLLASYMWFLGENNMNVPLYDYESKGCGDGLEQEGVSLNQGAESTLAYLISHLTVLRAHELEYET